MAFTRIRSGFLWVVGITSLVIVLFQFRYDVAKMIFGSSKWTKTNSKSGLQVQDRVREVNHAKSGKRRPIGKAHDVGRLKELAKKELRGRVKPGIRLVMKEMCHSSMKMLLVRLNRWGDTSCSGKC